MASRHLCSFLFQLQGAISCQVFGEVGDEFCPNLTLLNTFRSQTFFGRPPLSDFFPSSPLPPWLFPALLHSTFIYSFSRVLSRHLNVCPKQVCLSRLVGDATRWSFYQCLCSSSRTTLPCSGANLGAITLHTSSGITIYQFNFYQNS